MSLAPVRTFDQGELVLALAHRLVGSAAGNARRATREIDLAIRDRRALAPIQDGGASGVLTALTRDQSVDLLAAHRVGRLCYTARAGVPDVVPVNYALRGGRLLVRSGPGPKLQAAQRRETVALEVDEIDEETCVGCSVVVVGRARVLGPAEVAALCEQGPQPWVVGPRRHVLEVRLDRVTGRRLG